MMRAALIRLSRSKRIAGALSTNRLAWSAARRFVAGETVEQAVDVVRDLNGHGLLATLDRLGENVTAALEAEEAGAAYVDMVERILAAGLDATVSLKLTSMGLDIGDELATEQVRRIADRAAAADPPIEVTIDMESSAYTQRTLDIFHAVHRAQPHVAAVVQSYLYRTDDDVERLIEVGAHVRLCKGAYLEPPSVAYPDKKDADKAFLRQAARLLSAEARARGAYLGVATHDTAIIDWTKAFVAENGVSRDAFEFQMLHGVRRDLQAELAREGFRMRVYVPFGTHWYPYFTRRLAERPENVAFMVRNVAREMLRR